MENFERPIGGESWTIAPPRTMPWDRPPEFAEVGAGLKDVFDKLRQPTISRKLVNLMDAGIGIDVLAEGILMQGLGTGKYGAPGLMNMVGPTIVMMTRMAEEAGISPRYSTDEAENRIDFDPDELFLANKNFSGGRDNKANAAARIAGVSSDELSDEKTAQRKGFVELPKR